MYVYMILYHTYVCVCIHMHACMHTYIHTYIHTHTYMHTELYGQPPHALWTVHGQRRPSVWAVVGLHDVARGRQALRVRGYGHRVPGVCVCCLCVRAGRACGRACVCVCVCVRAFCACVRVCVLTFEDFFACQLIASLLAVATEDGDDDVHWLTYWVSLLLTLTLYYLLFTTYS